MSCPEGTTRSCLLDVTAILPLPPYHTYRIPITYISIAYSTVTTLGCFFDPKRDTGSVIPKLLRGWFSLLKAWIPGYKSVPQARIRL